MHVAVGGEGVTAVFARKWPFAAVHQHVTIETRAGAEHLRAYPAGIALFGILRRFRVVVVRAYMQGELVLGGEHAVANGAEEFSIRRAAVGSIVRFILRLRSIFVVHAAGEG